MAGRSRMNHIVYILFSDSLMTYYVGQTENLDRRLIDHNSGRGKHTSKGSPWRLIEKFDCRDRTEAVRLEKTIKKRGIKRYLLDKHLLDDNLGM